MVGIRHFINCVVFVATPLFCLAAAIYGLCISNLQSYTVSKQFQRTIGAMISLIPKQHTFFRHLVATCQPHRLWKFTKPMDGPLSCEFAPGHDCFPALKIWESRFEDQIQRLNIQNDSEQIQSKNYIAWVCVYIYIYIYTYIYIYVYILICFHFIDNII